MTLHEAVAKLTTLIPVLKASDAKFASDLIASYKKYGSLTPKQAPWIERLIARAETPVSTPVFSAPLTIPKTVDAVHVGDFTGVIALFNKAKEHLKSPKVNLLVGNLKIVLSVNGPKSKFPGAISISGAGKYPYRSYYGKVTPEGVFQPSYAGHDVAGLTALLSEFSANPARVAKDHGKLTGHCCFCNKVLGLGEDKRSVVVGFGPVCAEHYGLKDQWLQGAAKAEAKASVSEEIIGLAGLAESVAKITGTLPLSVQDAAKASLEAGFQKEIENLKKSTTATIAKIQQGFEHLQTAAATLPTFTSLSTALEATDTTTAISQEFESTQVVSAAPVAKIAECFFCEEATYDYTILQGYVVCSTCKDQLKGVSDGE